MIEYQNKLDFLVNCFKKKTPHSWLLHGPKGSGKTLFLNNCIKKIYKKKNYYQNVFEINNDDNIVLVEEIRNFINQSKLTNSNNKEKTFFIINNLELLNYNSLNALLKTVEEPPENTLIFLISNNLKLVPKTISSRCIKLFFNPYDSSLFHNLMSDYQNEIFELSNGQPEIFKILLTDEGKSLKNDIEFLINSSAPNQKIFEKLYTKVSKNFIKLFPIVINILYYKLKLRFIENSKDIKVTKTILVYLIFLKNNFDNRFILDKKRVFFMILNEYFKLNLNK